MVWSSTVSTILSPTRLAPPFLGLETQDPLNTNSSQSDITNTTYVNLVRSVKIPSGRRYRYVFSPPFNSDKPYLLFLHGFPETAYEWHYQITYFTEQGYGVIAPDLLGYGGTDNPYDLQAFNFKNMVDELGQLLDCEGIDTVIGISHDFARSILYEPSRLAAVAFLGNGYVAPQLQLDAPAVNAVNKATLARFEYQEYGYWLFNNEDEAGALIDQHLESFYSLMATRNSSSWTEDFMPVGAIREWLVQNKTASDVFSTRVNMEQWKLIMRAQGGLDGPLKWYKAMMRGINNPDSTDMSPSTLISHALTFMSDLNSSGAVPQPLLLILADRDPIAIPSLQLNSTVP
ncbi:alpha beta-hydrolase [Fusarium albosuccineum]|uniref:Alpha beta-hydrolase n=1 Tax=Fusarium albosuccineum TaxID=1237068 RepID=A0A8H4KTG2_9HYPO|nr:alpha beta-hydrolase [Fusarium albosuccineum]